MRHGRGVARGRAADAGLAKRADTLAREYGKAFSRSLLGAGGQHAEGFENDPIMYESIGWSGGPLPPKVEAELSGRLSQVLREDGGRLVETRQQEERHRREIRSKEAFDAWVRRKQAEARVRAEATTAAREMRTGSTPADLRYPAEHEHARQHAPRSPRHDASCQDPPYRESLKRWRSIHGFGP